MQSNSPRYETVTGTSPPPLYDGEGNLIWDGVNFMVYDFRNRLSEVYQCVGGAMASQSTSSSTTTSSSSSRTMIVPASKQDLQKAREEIKKKSIRGDLWGLLRDRPKEARATLKVQSGPKRKKGGPWAPAFEGELVLVALYAYDTHNRRIARQVALPFLIADHRYAYDGWREVEEMRPVTDASGTRAEAQKAFIWGRELDEMLAYYRKEGSPGSWVPYYPTQVRDESVVALLDASGSVVERVEYEPYGATTVFVGGTPQATSSVENPFLYTGKRLDPETGFYYYRNRYLHTGWGRFLTNDPIGGWVDDYNLGNAYAFVGNSPTNHFDWYGLQTANPQLPPRDLIGSNLSRGPAAGFLNARFSNGKILHIPIRTCMDCHQFQGNPFIWEQMKMANPSLEWATFWGDLAPIPIGGGPLLAGSRQILKGRAVVECRVLERVTGQALVQARKEFNNLVKPAYWREYANQIEAGLISNPFSGQTGNLARMRKGRPPIGPDGRPVNLHHQVPLQFGGSNSFGNLLPLTQSVHQRFTKVLHLPPFPGTRYHLYR